MSKQGPPPPAQPPNGPPPPLMFPGGPPPPLVPGGGAPAAPAVNAGKREASESQNQVSQGPQPPSGMPAVGAGPPPGMMPPGGMPPGGFAPRGMPGLPPPMHGPPGMMPFPPAMGGRPNMLGPGQIPPGPGNQGLPGYAPPPMGLSCLESPPGEGPSAQIWVGKIPPEVDNKFLTLLLERSGRMLSLKRLTDPDTDQPKAFGFAEFAHADGAVRALRVMQGLRLGDSELHLKASTKVTEVLKEHLKKKRSRAHYSAAPRAIDGSEVEADHKEEEVTDIMTSTDEEKALEDKIILDVQERVLKWNTERGVQSEADGDQDAEQASDEKSGQLGKADEEGLLQLDQFDKSKGDLTEQDKESHAAISKEILVFREQMKKKDEEKKQRARALALAEMEREKRRKEAAEKESKEATNLAQEGEKSHRDKDRDGRQHDDHRDRDRDRYRDRDKYRRDDRRGYDRESRRYDDRRDSRRYDDRRATGRDNDRDRGRNQDRDARRHSGEGGDRKRSRSRSPARAVDAPVTSNPQQDANKMVDDNSGGAAPAAAPQAEVQAPQEVKFSFGSKPSRKVERNASEKTAMTFDDGTEDGSKRMVLRKIEYTEEEREVEAEVELNRIISAAQSSSSADARLQVIVQHIPTEKQKLYSFKFSWKVFESKDILNQKMKSYIGQKVKEYIGEAEPSLIDFICNSIKQRKPAAELENALSDIFDSDGEKLTMLLWKMIVFETIRAQLPAFR